MPEKEVVELICDKCKKHYQMKRKSYLQRIRRNAPNYCKECMKSYAAAKINEAKANMNDEHKAEYSRKLSEANKNYWKNLSEDERNRRYELLRKQNDEYQKSLTPEQLKEHGKKIQASRGPISEEERKQMSERMTSYHANMTQEDKEKFSQQIKAGMSKMTKEEKQAMRNAWIDWWNNLPEDEISKHNQKLNQDRDHFLQNLTLEQRKELTAKSISGASGYNLFHKRFEEYFNHSSVSERFHIIPEYMAMNHENHLVHAWDFGVYENGTNELVMVVDLDGSYYHGDGNDYDGFHSKEEYDERRTMSVPDGVKYHIILEYQFIRSFDLMIKELMVDYDEYILQIFNMCRSMSFPYPKYSDKELVQSYQNLVKMKCNDKHHQSISLNTRVGDRLIQHFHESIYHAHTKDHITPYDAWHHDEILMECVKNRVIYQSYLNPNKILQGFNISKMAPKVSVFSAGRAKMIINRYLLEYHQIFDPFSGFSGRMLGAISLGKQYIGQDINETHVRESNDLINFLSSHFAFDAIIQHKDTLSSSGEYECLFTCPPYSDKEIWIGHEHEKALSCDDWIELCLENFHCRKYVFVIDATERYQDYIVDTIQNHSHISKNNELIVVIEK